MKPGHFLVAGLAALAAAIRGEEPALWKVQELIAAKKYVELMACQGTQRRLRSHNKGLIASTKDHSNLCIAEGRLNDSGAAQREKYLKTAWGKRYIKTRLWRYLTG